MASKSCAAPTRVVDAVFSDVDQMCSTVQLWDLDFRPLARFLDADCAGRIVQTNFDRVSLGYARFFTALDQFGAPPPGKWTFGLPEVQLKHLWWRGYNIQCDSIIVFPRGSELRSISGPDFEIHTISIDENMVDEICEAFKLSLPKRSSHVEVFRPTLQDLMYLRRQLRVLRDRPEESSAVEVQQISEMLILSWLDQSDQPRPLPSVRSRERAVTISLERMEAEDWAELTPAKLCETAGISVRTLQYAFRERFGITPAAFLKARRLGAIRNALKAANSSNLSVGDLAANFGFWHLGQFAADYRRMFGEFPSDTLKG